MYDESADHEEFMHGANDFAHARLAKRLMDKKRAAQAVGGAEPDGDTTQPPDAVAVESEESPHIDAAAEAVPEDAGATVPMELSPEEAELIKKMRAGQMG